jgi:hypothetical protein
MQVPRTFWLLLSMTLPFAASAAPQSQQASAPARSAVIGGEHFVKHVIADTQQGGMTAATIYLPESWHLESKVEWNYGWTEVPVAVSFQAENPANAEAAFFYPLLRADYIQIPPNLRQYVKNQPKPGERLPMGAINLDPRPPFQALALFVRKMRPNVEKFQWVGKQELPGLGKAIGFQAWPGEHGIAIKISYELNGQSVEEAFYGLYYLSQSGNLGDRSTSRVSKETEGNIAENRWSVSPPGRSPRPALRPLRPYPGARRRSHRSSPSTLTRRRTRRTPPAA